MKNHLIILQKILDGNLSCHFHWPKRNKILTHPKALWMGPSIMKRKQTSLT